MHTFTDDLATLPPDQQRVRAKCYHPTGIFNPFPKEALEHSIPARFEAMAQLYPDRLAVKTRHKAITYMELNQQANRIAHAILTVYGQDEEPVALLLQEGIAVATALLGSLKAGKLFVALDPSFPATRLAVILHNARARLLVTDSIHLPLAHKLAHHGSTLLDIDALQYIYTTENPGLSLPPNRLAYIVYTSGSTGEPTGVLYNHQSVLHLVKRLTNVYHICADDRLVPLQSWSFAPAVRSVFCSLLNGAAVIPFDLKGEGVGKLAPWLLQEQITITNLFASGFRQFVSTLSGEEAFPHLRLLIMGGEPLYKSDVELYKKHFTPSCILAHVMGSTELSTTRMYFVDGETLLVDDIVPPGYAVEETDIILLDETGAAIRGHEVGEIAVKSRYLAVGYWGNDTLTAARFVPDPTGGEERIYLTGDMGMMLPDGCLVHRGRKEFLVKIRGYRINPSEIETALLGEESIQEAVVVAREIPAGEQRLVAYVVPSSLYAPTVTDMRRSLAKTLPDYMIPTAFIMLEAFPRTPTGKVDRRALPVPGNSRPELNTTYVAPRTPVEKELTQIWAEVLSLDQVGIHDNFFDLGGHSLTASRVVYRVIQTFQLELPVRLLFDSPTVAEMALVIAANWAKLATQDELERMLSEVEAMSDEEAQRRVDETNSTMSKR
ncbi:MAG: non-ribosomal peptide synthetase [Deltaproteobacteria bacterium]|nr:non-ribosomal peptide synthetase [Deltaproteobacteria bacterium]